MSAMVRYGVAFVRLSPSLHQGRFVRRYKRFFVDVVLDDGREVVAHCPNTGSLRGCLVEGAPVCITHDPRPTRKLEWTWQLIRIGRTWVGVHTGFAVPLVEEALARDLVPELGGYERSVREVPYGAEGRSRIDLLLSRGGHVDPEVEALSLARRKKIRVPWVDDQRVYVEVKNTTLAVERDGERLGAFPDAVTERGRKHLRELQHVVDQGHRAAMVYCVQRSDVAAFVPADDIDPDYGIELRRALDHGVEAYALAAHVGPRQVRLARRLDIRLGR